MIGKTYFILLLALLSLSACHCAANPDTKGESAMVNPPLNNPCAYTGTDSERIEKALDWAVKHQKPLEITARVPDAEANRDFWLIDRAILLPSASELRLVNCRIKLSDRARDNFIRSANCGIGISRIEPANNIRIIGVGQAVLEGADRPRATGDAAKKLGERTFGTDAGKTDESQNGDWRNIGILLAETTDFVLENLEIRNSHCWAISLEYCRSGRVRNLRFASTGKMKIDEKQEIVLNQDGLDLRRGCRDILIEDISGFTGDDLVALTALRDAPAVAGRLGTTMVSASFPRGVEDDVSDITIRNVSGYCAGGHHIVRFLNASGIRMSGIVLDGLEDKSPFGFHDVAAVKIGDANPAWGGVTPLGDTTKFTIRNVRSKAQNTIFIGGSLTDSVLENVKNRYRSGQLLKLGSGAENLKNVKINDTTY